MSGRMIVHDIRVEGRIQAGSGTAPNIYRVDSSISVRHIFNWVRQYAEQRGGLDELFILAHGLTNRALHDSRLGMSYRATGGGGGIEIGREGLSLTNINIVSTLNTHVRKVTLFCCAIADNSDFRLTGTVYDGWQFCREFAGNCGCEVIASRSLQDYTRRADNFLTRIAGVANQIEWNSLINMEGPVFRFLPNGDTNRVS